MRRPVAAGRILAAVGAALSACSGAPADRGLPDGGCLPITLPAGCPEGGGDVPSDLRCTGLYGDFDGRALACGVREFAPGFPLWSDGAGKRRFVLLPVDGKIDVSDLDEWKFPVGTRLWKEFRVPIPGGGTALIETRFFWKMSDPDFPDGIWRWATYVWSADEKAALRNDDGVKGVRGTTYEIPTQKQCDTCHGGRQDKVLGLDAVLMSAPEATGLTVAELLRAGLLASSSGGPPTASELQIPGLPVERAALGYLHANCGVTCHNARSPSPANLSGLHLKLTAAGLGSAPATDAVVTGANKPPGDNWPGQPAAPNGGWFDIHPGDVGRSLLVARMAVRDLDVAGGRAQMPPLVSHLVDAGGVAAVEEWIRSMKVEAGYPSPAP